MHSPGKVMGEAQPGSPLAVRQPGGDTGAQSHRRSPAPCLRLAAGNGLSAA